MFVNVQRAARRLGVSPVTIRRWTATGFLPCIRTPGGHRRISTDDLDELARAIATDSALAAKVARERDLETVADVSVSLGSKHDLKEVLSEIANQITRILECDACVIYEYLAADHLARVVADYERSGRPCPPLGPYDLREFPLTRRVLEEHVTAHVDRDDPAADPAEVAALRADGDSQMLLIPLVYGGRSLGMVEAVWREKARRRTRQELRIAHAVADQAAVAIVNARAVSAGRSSDRRLARVHRSLRGLREGLPEAVRAGSLGDRLTALARAVLATTGAVSCRVTAGGRSGEAALAHDGPVSEVSAASSGYDVEVAIAVGLPRPADATVRELLDLAADVAAAIIAGAPPVAADGPATTPDAAATGDSSL